jgi:hypothetical protein
LTKKEGGWLYTRAATPWWYEFVFSGERIRESTKQGNKPRSGGCSIFCRISGPDLSIALPRVKLQGGENRQERGVSPEEEALYLAAAAPLLHDVALILFDCGLRPEEAYELKWPYIRNGNVENYEGKTPWPRHSIPATSRIMEMLEKRFTTATSE